MTHPPIPTSCIHPRHPMWRSQPCNLESSWQTGFAAQITTALGTGLGWWWKMGPFVVGWVGLEFDKDVLHCLTIRVIFFDIVWSSHLPASSHLVPEAGMREWMSQCFGCRVCTSHMSLRQSVWDALAIWALVPAKLEGYSPRCFASSFLGVTCVKRWSGECDTIIIMLIVTLEADFRWNSHWTGHHSI